MDNDTSPDKNSRRLLKLLYKHRDEKVEIAKSDRQYEVKAGKKNYRFSLRCVKLLHAQRFVKARNARIEITRAGVRAMKEALISHCDGEDYTDSAAANRANLHANCKGEAGWNKNESPLSRLFHRKTKTGAPYITPGEFEAGERIRRDFERALLQPKITANLSTFAGSARRGGYREKTDIADFALDARNRVYAATEILGPVLSGAVIDICCFLKGLETVERERSWPPRSAKLMLKTGLSLLADHYGITGHQKSRNARYSVWHCSDYRPEI